MYTDKIDAESKPYNNWVEILLDTPVPDGRHRIIEHVLAPYLINERHLDMDKTRQIIEKWVERSEVYELARGNINAFIERACYKASQYARKPKDLDWFKKNHKKVYQMISSIAEGYGLTIE